MKYFINAVMTTAFLFTASPAISATPTETFGNCLVDNLNGKERKGLAKWIFFVMAAHPEINTYLKTTATDLTESDKYMGNLVTRLLTEDCSNEMKAAAKVDPQAIKTAFELVGRVAMQELMTNQAVKSRIADYVQYTDQEKIQKVLGK